MSTISGTDSLSFLQNLGLNTTAGKSSEESADLFAATLQGIPAEEANEALSAEAGEAMPSVEVIDDMFDAASLTQAAAVTDSLDSDVEFGSSPAVQDSVQFFEDQLAMHTRFAADADKKLPERGTTSDKELAGLTRGKLLAPEQRETAPAKAKKALSADMNVPGAEADAAALRSDQDTQTDLPALANRNSEASGENTAAPTATVATAVLDDSLDLSTAGGMTRNTARTRSGLNLAPGFGSPAAVTGKGLPPGGKSLPTGKDSAVKADQSQDPSQILLAGFTEVPGLEEGNLSFDNLTRHFLAAQGSDNSQPSSSAASTTNTAFNDIAGDLAVDGSAPDLLPEFATAMLESDNTMGSYAWAEDTATQLSWLKEQGVEKAHIKLHPEDLGTLDVSITLNEGKAYVQFVTSTPEARELLQQSLPNLRDMLQQSGLSLAEGNVAQGDSRKGQDSNQNSPQQFAHAPEAPAQTNNWNRSAMQSRSQVDYYI